MDKTLVGGVLGGCSCLAPVRSSPTAGKAAAHSHFTSGSEVENSEEISEHPPVTSRAGAGSPNGYCPLEGVTLYSVIHCLHKSSNGVQMVANRHLPRLHQSW